jgi:hypothetical protein
LAAILGLLYFECSAKDYSGQYQGLHRSVSGTAQVSARE